MAAMTCRQLGGACDVVHVGDDANAVIEALGTLDADTGR